MDIDGKQFMKWIPVGRRKTGWPRITRREGVWSYTLERGLLLETPKEMKVER